MTEDFRLAFAAELYRALESLNADPELLAIVGSWGDTTDDEATLNHLRAYNKHGTIYKRVICQRTPPRAR